MRATLHGTIAVLALSAASAQAATWGEFVIRNATGSGNVPTITEKPSGAGVTTLVAEGGQKTGYGTNDYDGMLVTQLDEITYTRLDSNVHQVYGNIWVSDGTNFATITPRPVLNGGGYLTTELNGLNLQSIGFGVYETNLASLNWLWPGAVRTGAGDLLKTAGGAPVLISDLVGLIIDSPNDFGAYPYEGSGAAKAGYGVNIIFGDTASNHTGPYEIDNVVVSIVPEPAMGSLLLAGGLLLRRRK